MVRRHPPPSFALAAPALSPHAVVVAKRRRRIGSRPAEGVEPLPPSRLASVADDAEGFGNKRRGPKPHPLTQALRKRLVADEAANNVREAFHYVRWCREWLASHEEVGALRQISSMVSRELTLSDIRSGRQPTTQWQHPLTAALREQLKSDHEAGQLRSLDHYIQWCIDWQIARKDGHDLLRTPALVRRELSRYAERSEAALAKAAYQ